jgi:aspartyl/glutamyl-tRNA(Asn/Gln) amidotransferase C subunit
MSELLNHLCQLARISLACEERAVFSSKFESLLAFVERIKEVPLTGEGSALHITKEMLEPRADVPAAFPALDDLQKDYAAGHIGDLEEASE